MTSSIPFALPPVLSQRQFMQYYAIARAQSGVLEGKQAAYQAQYAWSTIEQVTRGQPADKPPVVEDPRVEALQQVVHTMSAQVSTLIVECSTLLQRLRALENLQPPVSESPGPPVSPS